MWRARPAVSHPGRNGVSSMMGAQPFETIVGAHHAEIYRYIRRVTSRATEAEDLSQETFLRAYRAYRSARSRSQRPRVAVRDRDEPDPQSLSLRETEAAWRTRPRRSSAARPTPTGRKAKRDSARPKCCSRATVGRLPLKQRMAFIMRKIHDLDYEAIGQSLDCSAESARAHVFQALRKIRLSLDGHALAPTTTEQPR